LISSYIESSHISWLSDKANLGPYDVYLNIIPIIFNAISYNLSGKSHKNPRIWIIYYRYYSEVETNRQLNLEGPVGFRKSFQEFTPVNTTIKYYSSVSKIIHGIE
jgi:hypothetical protein